VQRLVRRLGYHPSGHPPGGGCSLLWKNARYLGSSFSNRDRPSGGQTGTFPIPLRFLAVPVVRGRKTPEIPASDTAKGSKQVD
jgi:hypothetical protein